MDCKKCIKAAVESNIRFQDVETDDRFTFSMQNMRLLVTMCHRGITDFSSEFVDIHMQKLGIYR